jgi:hypothetical protein
LFSKNLLQPFLPLGVGLVAVRDGYSVRAKQENRTVSRIAYWRFALVFAAALFVPATAQAEDGLFGAILNFFSGGRPAQEQAPPLPPPSGPSAANPFDFPGFNSQPVAPSHGGPQVAYCVRTCDGRYFPMPRNAGGANSTPAKICSALCPTAETKIYSGSNIENAAASDGSRYSSLKNAFVYRDHLVEGCSCNGGDSAGNTAIDIKTDPTLRPGDIVVTGNGPVVFKGGKGSTYKMSDFSPAADSARLSAKMRDKMTAMKVARPGSTPTESPMDIAHASPAQIVPAAISESVSPAAAVAKIFDFKDFNASELRGSSAMGYNGQQ